MEATPRYPVQFSVTYPDRDLNRLTTFFRLIVAIPILIVAGTIGGHTSAYWGEHGSSVAGGTGGLLFLGHAETLRGVSTEFHLRQTHGTFYYGSSRDQVGPLRAA